jgi:predicted ATP-grasp superfamily ATP-dependent carboligase
LGGHVQGLGIIRSLGRRGIKVFLVDETPANIGRYSKYCDRFFLLPEMKKEKTLVTFLLELSDREGMQGWVLFPTHDATVEVLSRNREILSGSYRVSVPDWSVTEFAYNKILTYHLAKKTGVPVPHTYFPCDLDDVRRIGSEIQFPIIIKPAVMHKFYAKFKKKVYLAHNLNELVQMYQKTCSAIDPAEVMIQEIIPGGADTLYSCGCFFAQGTLKGSCIGKRCRQIPMDFGKATTYVKSVEIPQLRSDSVKLLSAIDYYGLAEVEFMEDPRDGVFKLLEINPRSWKWHTLAIKSGVDLPYLIYSDLVDGYTGPELTAQLNVKWMELISDLYISASEILKRRLSLHDYIDSFRGNLEFAIASWDDPKPFLSYILFIPYYLFSR